MDQLGERCNTKEKSKKKKKEKKNIGLKFGEEQWCRRDVGRLNLSSLDKSTSVGLINSIK